MTEDVEDVGYGRPPRKTRFQKGRSGNPLGRPKGSRSLLNELRAELLATTVVKEDGKELRVPKLRALIKGLIAAAEKGDNRAIGILMPLCDRAFPDNSRESNEQDEIDEQILDDHIEEEVERRMKARLRIKPNTDIEIRNRRKENGDSNE